MNGGVIMLYPVFSYDDGTEVTASNPDESGNILLYVEKFDTQLDCFVNATFQLPGVNIVSSSGYSKEKVDAMVKEYLAIQDDIVDYVMDKVKQSGAYSVPENFDDPDVYGIPGMFGLE